MVKAQSYKQQVFVPPLEHAKPNSIYPKFPPELNSFQSDDFYRDGYSYSDIDYQRLVSIQSNSKTFSTQIISSFDLFEDEIDFADEWLEEEDEDSPQDSDKRIKSDVHRISAVDEAPELAPFRYSPNIIWRKFFKFINSAYYFVVGEPIHSSPYIYWFFYSYFFFTEYTLVHITLYFPYLDILTYYPLFTTFDGVYFNFTDLIIGFYVPTLFLFIFSQYHMVQNVVGYRPYFFVGFSVFTVTLATIPVYYLTGFSVIIFFIFFISLLFTFSTFYIFEFSGFFKEKVIATSYYSAYFLPLPVVKKDMLYLPKFYYTYRKWIPVQPGIRKKVFTRVPFNINISKIILFKRRLKAFYEKKLYYKQRNKIVATPPSIPSLGLIFSKNSFGYSFPEHKQHITEYPDPEWRPLIQTEEAEVEESTEDLYFTIYGRDYMNHPLGMSNVSFIEFISENNFSYSVDYQFSNFDGEHRDFFSMPSSFAMAKELYPYYALRVWLATLNPSFYYEKDLVFSFENVVFKGRKPVIRENLENVYLFKPLVDFISYFFYYLDGVFDRITFYRYHKFSDPNNLEDVINELAKINVIFENNVSLSPMFYVRLSFYISRMSRLVKQSNYINVSPRISHYFSYWLFTIQLETILVTLLSYVEEGSKGQDFRSISICVRSINRNFEYLRRINVLLCVTGHRIAFLY